MSLNLESIILASSRDDGDELKRPTRDTPRPPAHKPEDAPEPASAGPEHHGDGIPRLDDLFHIPSWLPGTVVALLIAAAAVGIVAVAARSGGVRFA